MSRNRNLMSFLSTLCLLLVSLARPAVAEVAVVLMHDKYEGSGGPLAPLVAKLRQQDYRVLTPEMPWSKARAYDAGFEAGLKEVDVLVEELRAKNEDIIVFVGGQGLGANAAIAYAALHSYVDGVLAIAPAHVPDVAEFQAQLGDSVERARAMVAQGKAEQVDGFTDLHNQQPVAVKMPAQIYLSYFDDQGNAVMPKNASRLWEGLALLWVVGKDDPMAARGQEYAYGKAASYEFHRYLEIPGNRGQTPERAAVQVLAWMRAIIDSLQAFTEGIEETQLQPGVNTDGMGL